MYCGSIEVLGMRKSRELKKKVERRAKKITKVGTKVGKISTMQNEIVQQMSNVEKVRLQTWEGICLRQIQEAIIVICIFDRERNFSSHNARMQKCKITIVLFLNVNRVNVDKRWDTFGIIKTTTNTIDLVNYAFVAFIFREY